MKRDKLLEHMKANPAGWKAADVRRLLSMFGFVAEQRAKHELFYHPEHPNAYMTLTRSSGEVSPMYVRQAVSLVIQYGMESTD